MKTLGRRTSSGLVYLHATEFHFPAAVGGITLAVLAARLFPFFTFLCFFSDASELFFGERAIPGCQK